MTNYNKYPDPHWMDDDQSFTEPHRWYPHPEQPRTAKVLGWVGVGVILAAIAGAGILIAKFS